MYCLVGKVLVVIGLLDYGSLALAADCPNTPTYEGVVTLSDGASACSALGSGETDADRGKHFVTCSNGQLIQKDCTFGLSYDIVAHGCTWAPVATCSHSGNAGTVGPTLLTTESVQGTTQTRPSLTFSPSATESPPTSSGETTSFTTGETTSFTTNPACKTASSDGMLEFGCWGYKECVDNVVHEYRCPEGEVFERDTKSCIPQGTGNTVCGNVTVCPQNYEDVLYPDVGDQCQTFHRCINGTSFGRNYCPASLVFNFELQLCDYKSNVAAPCGTKSVVG